ncbi:hypothetical protein B0T20DRAFT_255680 [Sordaria brevicollis]|uniref:Uncharacterized protein n=1 Tax=Sordaria brevicollis TaxID=83679 RepID=A0AAE0PCE7_SORBR|nr:hypothetical protein B0T20DRAFT_255680 [Sordaria brevicollis]
MSARQHPLHRDTLMLQYLGLLFQSTSQPVTPVKPSRLCIPTFEPQSKLSVLVTLQPPRAATTGFSQYGVLWRHMPTAPAVDSSTVSLESRLYQAIPDSSQFSAGFQFLCSSAVLPSTVYLCTRRRRRRTLGTFALASFPRGSPGE